MKCIPGRKVHKYFGGYCEYCDACEHLEKKAQVQRARDKKRKEKKWRIGGQRYSKTVKEQDRDESLDK